MLCYLLLAGICSTWLTVSADEIYTAATLKKFAEFDELIDETVNPCDDFQKHVCSRKKVRFDANLYNIVQQRITNRVAAGVQPGDQEAVKKFYDFNERCKAGFGSHNASLLRLLDDLDSVFKNGGTEYQPFDATLVAKLTAYLNAKQGIPFFMGMKFVKPYTKTSRWYLKRKKVMHFFEFNLFLNRDYYDPKSLPYQKVFLFGQFQNAVAEAFPNLSAAEVNETASKFLKFEEELSKLLQYPIETTFDIKRKLHEVTVGEAMTKFPGMDWRTFVTAVSNYSGVDLLNGSSLEDYPMGFFVTDIVQGLLKTVKLMPEETLREYIRFRVIYDFNGSINKASSSDSCRSAALGMFPLVQQYFYLTETLPTPEDRFKFKESLGKLADDVVTSALGMLERVSWIKNDNQTFAGFIDKKNKLTKVIGFPDYLANQTWLDEYYKDFILDGANDLYSLFLRATIFNFKSKLGIRADVDQSILEPNAFCEITADKFQINLAFINDVLYNRDYIPVLNYGSLGYFIGHEFLHDFDVNGRNYDGDGHINPWMSAASKAKFDSMAQCVIDAYDKFNATDLTGKVTRINGTFTLGENMSDIGGIRAAYMAFKNNPAHTQSFPKTKKLEKYTQEQLFFLAFARTWCGPLRNSPSAIVNDIHSPEEIRILGTLQNFVPFREAFNCPVNSVYAPEKHCEVYTPDLDSGVPVTSLSFILLAVITFVNWQ